MEYNHKMCFVCYLKNNEICIPDSTTDKTVKLCFCCFGKLVEQYHLSTDGYETIMRNQKYYINSCTFCGSNSGAIKLLCCDSCTSEQHH
jgi:hypothetical protein